MASVFCAVLFPGQLGPELSGSVEIFVNFEKFSAITTFSIPSMLCLMVT